MNERLHANAVAGVQRLDRKSIAPARAANCNQAVSLGVKLVFG